MTTRLHLVLFLCLLILGFFLRFYRLSSIPPGLNQDETSIGYSAYSINTTGKDEYGKSFPVYFKSFGDQKLPIYIYLTALSEKLFGVNAFAVRFPSAFFGFLSLPLFYLLIKKLSKNETLALIAMAFLTINPWALLYNRAVYEVSISLFLFLAGTLLFKYGMHEAEKGMFLLGTMCFIASLYSYNLTRLLSPLLFLLVLLYMKKDLKKVQRGEYIITALLSLILLIPFALTFFSPEGIDSAKGTLITSSAAVQAPLLEFRGILLPVLPGGFIKLFFNSYLLTALEYFKHIVSYFSVNFLFLTGDPHGNHGIGNMGQLYLFEFPLVLWGIWTIFAKKYTWGYFLVLWGVLTILVAALTREAPQATRSFFLLVPLEAMSALGVYELFHVIKKQRRVVFVGVVGVSILCLCYSLLYFFTSYFVVFPVTYAKEWRTEDKALALYLKAKEPAYQQIVISKDANFIYTSLLFYTQYPPAQFQQSVVRARDDSEGFSRVTSFGKYTYRDILWPSDKEQEKTLFVSTLDKMPPGAKVLQRFSYPTYTVFFPVQQDITSLPVTETAYVVFTN